jgi:uncharacterized coiled-coil protein SlyX
MSNPIQYTVAIQDSPETVIRAAYPTTDLGSVDSNQIYMSNPFGNPVTVLSFGKQANTTWEIRFDPNITIHHHPPQINLISLADRTTVAGDAGRYKSDANSNVTETSWGSSSVDDIASLTTRVKSLEDRATSLENRCTNLEARATAVEGRCSALEGRCTTLESEVATLQSQMATVTNWMNSVVNTGLSTNGYVSAGGNINSTGGSIGSNGNVTAGGSMSVVGGISIGGSISAPNGSISLGGDITSPNGSIDVGGNITNGGTLHSKGQINTDLGVTAGFGTATYITLTGHTHPYNPPNPSTGQPNPQT